MKIDFLGIGAQKCASTWVHRVLSDHPEVAVYPGKEIDFFSYYYNFGYEWYEKHLGDTSSAKAVGDISASYFSDLAAPDRVFLYNPNMRIILSLRDPVERAYSNHLFEVKLGHVTGQNLDFENGLKNNPMYLMQSHYAQHLARWFAVFPKDQILVIFQEDIRDYPLVQAQNLYRFLGVSEDHQSWFLDKKVNESRVVKNSSLDSSLKKLGKLGRSVGGSGIVEAIKKSDFVRRLRRNYNQIDLRKVIPPMREDTRIRLQEMLAEDMRELVHLLGRENLPWPSWSAVQKKS
ncbi:sulfotransferase [Nitrosomonas sp. Nm166]|uniref:sulfotransferase family protein n=1 Tax=Nitrosomonas sp. Nm166 TaxID=1881054 RepID=UPI0008EE06B7|nr:sulfotransferase [Nitrosomonas sp. Nm166]SFD95255.1 Sulfotransferase domain-containing protein [Nitrosomonas sp. Nm166]